MGIGPPGGIVVLGLVIPTLFAADQTVVIFKSLEVLKHTRGLRLASDSRP
jgi:hypothetical protein